MEHILSRGKNQISALVTDKDIISALIKCISRSLEVALKSSAVLKSLFTDTKTMTTSSLWNFVQNELEKFSYDDIIKLRIQEVTLFKLIAILTFASFSEVTFQLLKVVG